MSDAMDPKRRMELEAAALEVRSRYNPAISLSAMRKAPHAHSQWVKVFREGDSVWLAFVDDENSNISTIRIDAVVACTMAIDVLELSKSLFPGDFDIQVESAPPKDKQS